jgi:hypothetical protein
VYELPDDDSLGIETCCNVECHLLNWVLFDWHVYIVILLEYLYIIFTCDWWLRWVKKHNVVGKNRGDVVWQSCHLIVDNFVAAD